MRRSHVAGLVLATLAAVICVGEQLPSVPGQNAPEVTSSQTVAAFKTVTNVVPVPVVVRDKDGHAVGNLRAEDFRLTDNGKAQLISRFTLEEMRADESLQTRAGGVDAAGHVVMAQSLPNRFVGYLIDKSGIDWPPDIPELNKVIFDQIDSMGPSSRAAIYSAWGGVVVPFTADRTALRNGVARAGFRGGGGGEPGGSYKAALLVNGDPGALLDAIPSHDRDDATAQEHVVMEAEATLRKVNQSARTYLGALESLIESMAGLPGERSIVLVSAGAYITNDLQEMSDAVLAKAISAGIVISGFDPSGISTAPATRYTMAEELARAGFGYDMAQGTGGTYEKGHKDFALAMRRAASVPEFVYLLSFSPQDLKFDGKLHTLGVSLRNSRGMLVQHREHYRAPSGSEDPADAVKQQIEEAFFSSEEVGDLPVRVQTQFFRDGDDATLNVIARVDAAKLPFRKEDGRNRDRLTMVVGLFDVNGNYVSALQKDVEMNLKDETLSAWMKSGIETKAEFSVKPGKYLVRLVVRDSEGESMAEQSTGVEIP